MSDIFQELWDADQMGAGVPALRPTETGDGGRGFVVVDERHVGVGPDHKVLKSVVIPDAKRETYALCERLFDNYALEFAARERIDETETREERDFIDAILPTDVIQLAKRLLERDLDSVVSDAMLASMIRETWFAMGPAGPSASSQQEASGFEHVFVGEQSKRSGGAEIGGYHFWYKYHLDDGRGVAPRADEDRVEYLGTRYQEAHRPQEGVLIPEVVTMRFSWEAPFGDQAGVGATASARRLHKPIGGFFVGCSPEGLIAMGLVRARIRGDQATINGAEYKLDFHPLHKRPDAIRTFFPRFKRAHVIGIDDGGSGAGSGDDAAPRPEAPFRILAGMINPENPEGGREFLQIVNRSAAPASLKDWMIAAPNGVRFRLSDIPVAPGDVFRFVLPSANGILRNKTGTIQLLTPNGAVAQEAAYSSDQAQREGQPILFG